MVDHGQSEAHLGGWNMPWLNGAFGSIRPDAIRLDIWPGEPMWPDMWPDIWPGEPICPDMWPDIWPDIWWPDIWWPDIRFDISYATMKGGGGRGE